MMSLLKRFSYDTKLSHKLFYMMMLVVIIPILFLGIMFNQRFEDIIEEEIGFSYEQIVSQYTDNISYKLEIYQNLLENIVLDKTIQKVFLDQQSRKASDTVTVGEQITDEVESLIFGKNLNEIHSLKIYAYSEGFPSDGRYISSLSRVKGEPWYEELLNSSEKGRQFTYVTEGLKRQIISFTKPIFNLNGQRFAEKLGIVKLDIDAEKMFGVNEMMARVNCDAILLFSSDGQLLSGSLSGGIDPNSVWGLYQEKNAAGWNSQIKFQGSQKIVALKSAAAYGWLAFFVFPFDEIESEVNAMTVQVLLVSAVLLVVLLGLTGVFSYLFSRRIRQLIHKMNRVEEGNLEITEVMPGRDEISLVDKHFNQMVDKLRRQIDENYVQKLERREAELNALQAQINPHFLYNTLEAVNAIGAMYGSTEICTISQNLSDMFRYSINIGRKEFVTLADELAHIRNYVSIQQIRFDNAFEVTYDVPKELEKCRILKFILQPIAENAFTHAFRGKKKGGLLTISAARSGDRLVICVEDNGKGMAPIRLEELETSLNQKKRSIISTERMSIGVTNVHSRIQLAYGGGFGLSFQSREDAGTKVTITLPYEL